MEDEVVVKVRELLGALDEVKRYNELSKSLRTFAAIVVASIAALVVLRIIVGSLRLSSVIGRFESVVVLGVLLLIPLAGIVMSVLYVSRRVKAVAQDEREADLSGGFPAALETLSNLDWARSIDDVSRSRITYALYSVIKLGAYSVFIFFGLDIFGGLFLAGLHLSPLSAAVVWTLVSLLAVMIIFGRDILRRYREVQSLNTLLQELRSFNNEFERAEFEQLKA